MGKKKWGKVPDFSLVKAGVQLGQHSEFYSCEVKLSLRHWGWQLIKLVTLGRAEQGTLHRAQVLLMQGCCCQLENKIPSHAQECDLKPIFDPNWGKM